MSTKYDEFIDLSTLIIDQPVLDPNFNNTRRNIREMIGYINESIVAGEDPEKTIDPYLLNHLQIILDLISEEQ